MSEQKEPLLETWCHSCFKTLFVEPPATPEKHPGSFYCDERLRVAVEAAEGLKAKA